MSAFARSHISTCLSAGLTSTCDKKHKSVSAGHVHRMRYQLRASQTNCCVPCRCCDTEQFSCYKADMIDSVARRLTASCDTS